MPKTTSLSDWISTADAAALLEMTQRNVRYLIRDSKLDSQQIAGRLVVSLSSVNQYIAEHGKLKRTKGKTIA